uniref:Uncharacterized protein n=1 Tax=Bos indicus x Bos taurus TaxID=30522 RepID=A0A4W2CGD8_BOBOX
MLLHLGKQMNHKFNYFMTLVKDFIFPTGGQGFWCWLKMPTGNCWVSWTTSFRTKIASSSSPRCMTAKGPSLCLGPLGVGRTEESDNPLGPYFQIFLSPLAAFFTTLSLELPPGREKRPGAKNEPFSGT